MHRSRNGTKQNTTTTSRLPPLEVKAQHANNGQNQSLPNLLRPPSHPLPTSTQRREVLDKTPKRGTKTAANRTTTQTTIRPGSTTIPSFGTPTFKRRKRGRKARLVPIRPETATSRAPTTPSTFSTTTTTAMNGIAGWPDTYQYTTTLIRRAVRKPKPLNGGSSQDENTSPVTTSDNKKKSSDDSVDGHSPSSSSSELYGDVSLGMKLIVVGGKVIVQTLNALEDGKASPAQLTGLIQRGDVLLAIEDVSLTQLPIDQLMTSLQPLSTPETSDGRYRKTLTLRLEAGTGHDLLQSYERDTIVQRPAASAILDTPTAAVHDMFSLFPPMVDQLSGTPLMFDFATHLNAENPDPSASEHQQDLKDENDQDVKSNNDENEENGPENILNQSTNTQDSGSYPNVSTADQVIADVIAQELSKDRKHFSSLFFNWRDHVPKHLGSSIQGLMDDGITTDRVGTTSLAMETSMLTKSQRIEMGTKILKLTQHLTQSMEDMHKGKDLRSFKVWSTNFSMRSGATTRRRAVMDAASLRSHRRPHLTGQRPAIRDSSGTDDDDDSTGSGETSSGGSLDPDALLLGLAARDDIWRKNVLDALKEAIGKMERGDDLVGDEDERQQKTTKYEDDQADLALSNHFENFLFGEHIKKIIKKQKRSYALPPEDITTVLFDLSTHITTAAPEEVTIFGGTTNSFSLQSSFGTQTKNTKAQLHADIMQAHFFLLHEALPVWLKAFRPLGLVQRRLFWPTISRHAGSHTVAMTHHGSDNDSLTIDSHEGELMSSAGWTMKNLQERVEDLELDVETRSETCFLVTYYFSQKILTQYSSCSSDDDTKAVDSEVAAFLHRFGTYLQIHSCLVFSAKVEAEKAIDQLLEVARHDPSHQEARKELTKANALTFYDATKLSALLELLGNIRNSSTPHVDMIKNLCVAAYPDVMPWQVRKACLDSAQPQDVGKSDSQGKLQEDVYYSYLSQLLDPVDGDDSARRDNELVMEWCRWSAGVSFGEDYRSANRDRIKNFYLVASRASSAHRSYRRNLVALLDASMEIKEYDLALELMSEIIEDRKLCSRAKDVKQVRLRLREIATLGLQSAWISRSDRNGFHLLKRAVRGFHDMSRSGFLTCRESIDVPEELLSLLEAWEKLASSSDGVATEDLVIMVDFLINEAAPSDVLSALALWTSTKRLGDAVYSQLERLLCRGAQRALRSEISSSLLQLKHIRKSYRTENAPLASGRGTPNKLNEASSGGRVSIWQQMSVGALTIDK